MTIKSAAKQPNQRARREVDRPAEQTSHYLASRAQHYATPIRAQVLNRKRAGVTARSLP